MKKISVIWILPIMLLLCCWLFVMVNYIDKKSLISFEERLSYVDVDNDIKIYNEKNH